MPKLFRHSLAVASIASPLLGLIAAGCGAGTAGLVSGSGGSGSGGNAPPAISAFTITDPKLSPTQIRFVLSDAEANAAQVELRYQVGGAPAQRLTQLSGVNANPATLATSAKAMMAETTAELCGVMPRSRTKERSIFSSEIGRVVR